MNIPVNFLTWGMAALPIVTLLVLMVKFQWGAKKAAPVGLLIALASSLTIYKADLQLVFFESLKGAWSAVTVLLVVFTAILIYEVVNEAKGFEVFKAGIQKVSPNELIQVLSFGWVFVSFLQGITGFGVPVAVGAPLLVGIGVKPGWAVFIPLIGHAWANTFGTLAVAWDALVLQTNLAADPELLLRTALWTASFIWIWNFLSGIVITWVYGGKEALKKGWPAVILISVIHGGGQLVLSQFNQTLAAFVPALVALVVVLFLGKTKRFGSKWRIEDSKVMDRSTDKKKIVDYPKDMNINQAFMPYYVLTFITLFVLLIQPIKNFLGQVTIGFSFPETSTGYGLVNEAVTKFSPLAPFTHASLFLVTSAILGFFFYKSNGWLKEGDFNIALGKATAKTVPSSVSVIGFIVMSRIMGSTGQTYVLAEGIASVFGQGYVLLSPLIGMLGSFMTSSNMAANILFGNFQLQTANVLNMDPAPFLAAQTAGGAIGNVLSPGNIILGCTTAGILGKEGLILKRVLPLAISVAATIGVIMFVMLIIL